MKTNHFNLKILVVLIVFSVSTFAVHAQGFFKKTEAASAPATTAPKVAAPSAVAPVPFPVPMPKPVPVPAAPVAIEPIVSKPTMAPAAPMPLPRQEQSKSVGAMPAVEDNPKAARKPHKLSVLEQSKLDVKNASVLARKGMPNEKAALPATPQVVGVAAKSLPAAPVVAAASTPAAKNPSEACSSATNAAGISGFGFITKPVCISFQCLKDDFKKHPECVQIAAEQQKRTSNSQDQFR